MSKRTYLEITNFITEIPKEEARDQFCQQTFDDYYDPSFTLICIHT